MRILRAVAAAALAALAAALPGAARAQEEGAVRRGAIERRVKTSGTVVYDDVFRLKASIDGRIEAVLASSYTWAGPESPLALMADQSLSALIDNRQTTPTEVLEDRWRKVFQPAQIRCVEDCFVLAVYARPKKRGLPQAALFEAASTVRLIGKIRAQDRGWIQGGQTVVFWSPDDPQDKKRAVVGKFVLDVQGQKSDTGGTFSARLNRQQYLDPGTQWEGYVIAERKKDALQVPTAALISYKDGVYLPVRVSTGITNDDMTEIAAGIDVNRGILTLKASDLAAAKAHSPSPAPPPPPKNYFELGQPDGNRALDDSPYDKPGDEDE